MTKIHISGWKTNKLQVFSITQKEGRSKIRQAKKGINDFTKKEVKLSLREAMILVMPAASQSAHDLSELVVRTK